MKSRPSFLIILAVLLIALPTIGPENPFRLLDPIMSRFSDSVQMVLCIFIMPLMALHGFSYMIGTGILALLAGHSVRNRVLVNPQPWEPLAAPSISLLWLASQSLPFLRLPAGTPIRPMGWAMYVMMSSLILTIVCIIKTIASLRKGKNKTACVVALIVSIGLLIIPSVSLHTVARVKGLVLSP